MKKIIKRSGEEVLFDKTKIVNAIQKANAEVDDIHKLSDVQISAVADNIEDTVEKALHAVSVEEIQDMVETGIMQMRGYEVAQKYIRYRYKRNLARKSNTTDDSILALLNLSNEEAKQENSNKNPVINSTQRDYMAGEVSKDLTRRVLLSDDIVKAHDEGIIHFHDADYFAQHESNCCLINLEDMLQNGTVITGTLIEKPHSFYTACNITTQIVAQVASSQYGGQTFTLSHLAPFVDVSRRKILQTVKSEMEGVPVSNEQIDRIVKSRLLDEIKRGIQTIQYQLITLMTCNGQAPFVTMFMYLDEVPEGQTRDDLALIIEEALRQRIEGVKNEAGVWVTPAFPKIIYVLDEDNIHEDSKYFYLTELAAKCTAKRMVPDYISAKVMKEMKEGDVYPCMGCVDKDEVISYELDGVRYTESFQRAWRRLAMRFDVKVQPGRTEDFYMDPVGVTVWDNKENRYVPMKRIIRNKSKKWLDLSFANGRVLTCTPDHPFETVNRGVVLAKDLTAEDIIPADKKSAFVEGTKQMSTDTAWTLGLILCDGCYDYDGRLYVSLGADETDIGEAFMDRFSRKFSIGVTKIERDRKGSRWNDYAAVSDMGMAEIELVVATVHSMFEGKKKIDRHIPNEVFTWTREARLAFLAGMIDADGHVDDNMTLCKIRIGSTNKELAIQQMLLAQSCGMPASMHIDHYAGKAAGKVRYRVWFVPTEELMSYIVSGKKRNSMTCNTRIRKSVAQTSTCVLSNRTAYTDENAYSYDVTTESEHFTVSGLYSHNCRSFLTVDNEDTREGLCNAGNKANAGNYKEGQHKYYGRYNQGVVTINLVDVACSAAGDMDAFWKIFDDRLELCHKALRARHERLLGTTSDVAPILWQYGAYARLKKGEKIDRLLYGNYSTLSLGYAGLYEMCYRMIGKSHTSDEGKKFALAVMQKMNDKCAEWREKENISYSLYGTPRPDSRGACTETCSEKVA